MAARRQSATSGRSPSSTSAPASSRPGPARFVEEVLIPLEEEAERAAAGFRDETIDRVKRAAIEAGLNGALHPPEYGGQGWTRTEWALVEEQFGRSHQRDLLARPQRLQRLGRTPATSSASAICAPPCAASCRTPTR